MRAALKARLNAIDGKTIIKGGELEIVRIEYEWQANNHPNAEMRGMFRRLLNVRKLRRAVAREAAQHAYFPMKRTHDQV